MNTYRETLAIVTNIINSNNGTFKTPAIKVSPSPKKGNQLNNSDHLPYFKNHLEELFKFFSLKGNHFLFLNLMK